MAQQQQYSGSGENRARIAKKMVKKSIKWKDESREWKKRTGDDDEDLEYMDCSEFVNRVIAIDGMTGKGKNGKPKNLGAGTAILVQKFLVLVTKGEMEQDDTPQIGDIYLEWGFNPEMNNGAGGYSGHAAIVTDVDPASGMIKMTQALGENRIAKTDASFWKFDKSKHPRYVGFFRPSNTFKVIK